MHLLILQAVLHREFACEEQVAEVGLSFQILKDPEPPRSAEGLLRSPVTCHAQLAHLPCPENCLCVLSLLGVVTIWKVSMSKTLLAELQMQVLHYTRKIKGVKKLLDFFNGIKRLIEV